MPSVVVGMSLAGLPQPIPEVVSPLHAALRAHPVYARVTSREALAVFMAHHVFAVWDFMSLLKRLQQDLTVVEVPWRPGRDPDMARLINEIVLAEESDVVEGRAVSHFGLYREAMREVGADTRAIDALVERVADSAREADVDAAVATIPAPCVPFVRATLRTARHGSTLEAAASFLLGREDIIPAMFSRLRDTIPAGPPPRAFVAYLERHIHIDADEHGPAAARLLRRLIGDDRERAVEVAAAASAACRARLALWDGIADVLP